MNLLKKLLRWLVLVFLIILALSGAGIGAVLTPKREKDFDHEVKIELVDEELGSDLIINVKEKVYDVS